MLSSTGFTSCILSLAIVLCWMIAASVPAACLGSGGRNDVINYFFYAGNDGELKYSWDAGVLDGAIHLTADDVYQPPVQYPPDGKRSAGRVFLWVGPSYIDDRTWEELRSHEASFNTSFTMSVSRSHQRDDDDGGLLLEVMPKFREGFDRTIYYPLARTTTTSGNISIEIGTLKYYYNEDTRGVYVSVAPAGTAKHTVWVDYDAVRHNLSVYVDDGGKPKPAHSTLHAPLDIDSILGNGYDSFYKYFGLFASKNRSLPSCQPVIYSWNVTADRFTATSDHSPLRTGWIVSAIALSSVLVAAIILVALRWSRLVSWYRALVMKLKLSRALRRLPGMPREFKFADVRKATRNFHDSNRLGRGGFGAVYKGTIIMTSHGGEERRHRQRYVEVAVKKFTRKEDHCYDDFMAEVAIINRLRHKNIVPLLGWCFENGELLLIYQYMPNGSLDQHLFRDRHPTLRWETRYRVLADVAAALHYVHHEYERVVLHRDIKASNIMLDANFNGRLGDFGLAGLADVDKNSLTDPGVAGTWGFIAPEYAVSHKATRQTDVYAFGALVLEVVTGKRSLGVAGSEFPLLTDWVWWLHGEGRLLEAVDEDLTAARELDHPDVSTRLLDTSTIAGGEFDATRLLLLGLACTNPNPLDRPTTADLVLVIAKRIAPPVVPLVKPTFVWPLDGEFPLLDDLEDEEPDHSLTGIHSRQGLAFSIGSLSLEIMVCRSHRSLP